MLINPQHGDPVEPSRVIDQHPLAFSDDRIVGGPPRDTMSRTRPRPPQFRHQSSASTMRHLQHHPARTHVLTGHLQPEPIKPAEHGQTRHAEDSVGHVEVFQMGGVRTSIFGRPRPLIQPPRRNPCPHPRLGSAGIVPRPNSSSAVIGYRGRRRAKLRVSVMMVSLDAC